MLIGSCASTGFADKSRDLTAGTQKADVGGKKDPAPENTASSASAGGDTTAAESPSEPSSPEVPVPEGAFSGYWSGVLNTGSSTLSIMFSIHPTNAGYFTTMDIPQQNAKEFPSSSTETTGRTIIVKFANVGAEYKGALAPDCNSIEGTWTQSGMSFLLSLEKGDKASARRPQDPVRPYPYKEEDVLFVNETAGVILGGTLTYPEGEGVFPAVLLVTGSGPQDRNEEIFNHRPFLVIADYLTRKGFAVLRYDDRGTRQSTGDFDSATTLDFAGDALAGIEYLVNLPMVDKKHIGVIGHSEGGLIAPMLAVSTKLVSFIVMLAGPGLPGDELLLLQNRAIMLAAGQSPAQVEQANGINKDVYTIIIHEKDLNTAGARVREYLERLKLPQGQLNAVLGQVLTPWYRTYLSYDPGPVLAKVTVPVLALNGGKDLQIPPMENLAALKKAFTEGGNTNVTLKVAEGLNHLFQHAVTGLMDEYGAIPETIAPEVLKLIGDWLAGITGYAPRS